MKRNVSVVRFQRTASVSLMRSTSHTRATPHLETGRTFAI
uniref:Uncharacterized protein n=1 Tax=Anguilla anguilla TaxID=7936 RepID=A0A0E9RZW3_ANGAN